MLSALVPEAICKSLIESQIPAIIDGLEEMRREEMIRLLNILLLFALDTHRDLDRKDPVYIEASYLASHNQ